MKKAVATVVAAVCDLCTNPYPFMCSECASEVDDGDRHGSVNEERASNPVPARPRIWVGSGEDFLPA